MILPVIRTLVLLIFFCVQNSYQGGKKCNSLANSHFHTKLTKSTEYDISAKNMAKMCHSINPAAKAKQASEPGKESYLRHGKCWKFEWQHYCPNRKEDDRLGKSVFLTLHFIPEILNY